MVWVEELASSNFTSIFHKRNQHYTFQKKSSNSEVTGAEREASQKLLEEKSMLIAPWISAPSGNVGQAWCINKINCLTAEGYIIEQRKNKWFLKSCHFELTLLYKKRKVIQSKTGEIWAAIE